jgi:hypothetical protein
VVDVTTATGGKTMNDLQQHVYEIAQRLGDFDKCKEWVEGDDEWSVYDYLQDVLDIEYIIGSDGTYRGARILVAFGGPNIWIDTRHKLVEGYWWQNKAQCSFDDDIGLCDALEELYEVSK